MHSPSHWTAVVAANPLGVIGRDGQMPWHLSADLRRFKQLTVGSPVVMGRKTFDSIGKPLPSRANYVLSRSAPDNKRSLQDAASSATPGTSLHWVDSVENLIEALADSPRVYVIGGAAIFDALLPRCAQVFLTVVWTQTPGDTFLQLSLDDFRCSFTQRQPQTPKDSVPTEFQIWNRIAGADPAPHAPPS